MNDDVKIFATYKVVSNKVLNLYSDKFNRTDNNKLTIRDFCFKIDRLTLLATADQDQALTRSNALRSIRATITEMTQLLDVKINEVLIAFDAKNTKALVYDKTMFDHGEYLPDIMRANKPYEFDVIWNLSIIWAFLNIINRVQYITLLTQQAKKMGVLSGGEIKDNYRILYVMPIQRVLYHSEEVFKKIPSLV